MEKRVILYSGHSLLPIRKPGFIRSKSSLSGMGRWVGFKWFLLPNINSESCSQPEPHACWHQKSSVCRNRAWGKAAVTQLSFAEPDTQARRWCGYSQPDTDRRDAPLTSTTYCVSWDKPYSACSGVVFLQDEWGRNGANESMSMLISFQSWRSNGSMFVCLFFKNTLKYAFLIFEHFSEFLSNHTGNKAC